MHDFIGNLFVKLVLFVFHVPRTKTEPDETGTDLDLLHYAPDVDEYRDAMENIDLHFAPTFMYVAMPVTHFPCTEFSRYMAMLDLLRELERLEAKQAAMTIGYETDDLWFDPGPFVAPTEWIVDHERW